MTTEVIPSVTVQSPAPVEPPEAVVTLSISETDARLLQTLIYRFNTGLTSRVVDKLPDTLRERYSDESYGPRLNAIYSALAQAGYLTLVGTLARSDKSRKDS